MSKLIEVYMKENKVTGHILDEQFIDGDAALEHIRENYKAIIDTSNYPFKDLVWGIGHAECVIPLDGSYECFGVGEKGIILVLSDGVEHPHLLYQNCKESDEILLE